MAKEPKAPRPKRDADSEADATEAIKTRLTKAGKEGRETRATRADGTKATKAGTKAGAKEPRTPRKARSVKKSPRKAGGGGFRAWLAWEIFTWGAGLTVGAGLVAAVLWGRAQQDVQGWLANPPKTSPSIVYSAPMELREGQQASVSDLAGELLAAGYERVPTVTSAGQFRLVGDQFDIFTGKMDGPGFTVDEARVSVTMNADGVVTDVTPGDRTVFWPSALATVGDPENRRARVKIDEVSPYVEQAIVAMEDQRFRSHHGVDPFGVARAVVHNVRGDGGTHGGSTLTQQIAKNLFLSPERTMQRKVREAFFAMALESQLSKDEIFEIYVNEVYLGQAGGVPVYGVEQAARAWFGVSAKTLTLGEAAAIGGVISSPNAYSPVKHPEETLKRRDLALDRMVTMGFIDVATAAAEKKKDLVIDGSLPGAVRRAPWAVDEAVAYAEGALGDGALASGGYAVYTTIQPLAQRAAERSLRDGISEVETQYPKAKGTEAALIALRDDGAVIAMVGGRDYIKSPFDRAADAWREVGSTVKPFTLLAAFDADDSMTPLTRISDTAIAREMDGKTWRPENYDGTFHGEVTIRTALENSYNIPAIRLSEQVGLPELQSFLREVGLSKATNWPSVALGGFAATPWEVAGAYTVFPGGGTRHDPYVVRGISDADGKDVLVFETKSRRVASARATALTTSVLQGVIQDGTGARAKAYGVTGQVGGKSGTTNDYRDAWFVGFTPEVVAAVWVGRDRGGDIGLSGGRGALPAWGRFIASLGPNTSKFDIPDGVIGAAVCPQSERMAKQGCPTRYTELFPVGHVPGGGCDIHTGAAITPVATTVSADVVPDVPNPTVAPTDPALTQREERRAEREQQRIERQ